MAMAAETKNPETKNLRKDLNEDPNAGFGFETCVCGNVTREAECELCGERLRG